jgi:enoyl-CoA hydratase
MERPFPDGEHHTVSQPAPQIENAAADEILYEVRDGIAHVTFNRPQARNALTFAMYQGLADICTAIDADRSVKALVITGAGGRAFAAGTDIAQFLDFKTPQQGIDYETKMEAILQTLERCRVPTIAAISGACTGGGAAIAACCDIRIGTQSAKFGFPIARTLGNCLSMSNYARLSALIGPQRTKEMIFTARLIEAEEALTLGLVSELVADFDALNARAEELARLLASHAPLTLQATKEALRRLADRVEPGADEDLVVMCYTSEDFREGMDAFLNKRAPRWQGR